MLTVLDGPTWNTRLELLPLGRQYQPVRVALQREQFLLDAQLF